MVERADELIAKTDDHDQVNNAARLFRARAFAMLGRIAEGLAESEQALVGAREVADPQHLGPALACPRVRALRGRPRRRKRMRSPTSCSAIRWLLQSLQQIPDLPLLLAEHGRGTDYTAAAAHLPRLGLWPDAADAAAAGEFAHAADVVLARSEHRSTKRGRTCSRRSMVRAPISRARAPSSLARARRSTCGAARR